MTKNRINKNIIAIAILVVVNIWLLYSYNRIKNEYSQLSEKVKINEYNLGYTISTRYKQLSFINKCDKEFCLQVFLTDMGCKSCVESYIKRINGIYAKYSSNIKIYLIGKNKNYLVNKNIKFKYEYYDKTAEYYSIMETNQPAAVFATSKNEVLLSNVALVTEKTDTDLFYDVVEKLLKLCEGFK